MPRRAQGKRTIAADGSVAVRGKAPNGVGSIYPIADGSWRANWTDRTGRRRSVRGRTHAEAISRREAAQAADDEVANAARRVPKRFSPRTTTVNDVAAWWLNQQRHRVRVSSLGKYADRVDRFRAVLGPELVSELTAEQVASWQSELLDKLSPSTVADTRSTLVAVLGAAQDLGLVAANVAHRVKPPRVPKSAGRAITPVEVRALLGAASSHRLGAAVAFLFVQGWRVSEVLGLAWQDVDLESATAHVVRAGVYVDGIGMVLGPPKTSGAIGVHILAPGVVDALRRRLEQQHVERAAAGERWDGPHEYGGRKVDLVFTTADGRIVTRQTVTKVIASAAEDAGLDPARLGTHVGRRSVITALYAHGGASIDDIANHVGHDSTATTAGYIRDLGRRPERTARLAAELLDFTAPAGRRSSER
jgi:integrase